MMASPRLNLRYLFPLAAVLSLLSVLGCAAVPRIDDFLEPGVGSSVHPEIVGASGPLSPKQSKAVIAKLEQETGGSDVLQRHLALEAALDDAPLVVGNKVTLLRNGMATFREMFRAIRRAKNHIDLEYYIVEDIDVDGVHLSDLLIEKRKRGVEVNLIYDAFGSLDTPSSFFERLRAAGVNLLEFHPLNPLAAKAGYSINDRDHRKIFVVDGRIGIMGGVNLSTVYERNPPEPRSGEPVSGHPWRDSDIEIEGPAVAQLEKLFLATWSLNKGAPLSTRVNSFPPIAAMGNETVRVLGSAPERGLPQYYISLVSAIRNAESRIWISAAYFVPTHDEEEALLAAARRGVDVRLLLPGISDSEAALAVGHSHYEDLLEAGAHIFEYRRSMLHSKYIIVDDVWSVVGSSNFDHRSVLFNNEVDAVLLGRDTAAQLESLFRDESARAVAIDLAKWRERPIGERLHEFLARTWQVLL